MRPSFTIALAGNPNSGKSSLFNSLTGLNQRVGNFPGVTVDKKTGSFLVAEKLQASVLDLPGTYSLYPKSADEQVTYEVLLDTNHKDKPDIIIVIADASNLRRNLLFCSQIMDLGIPVIMALTMNDIARQKGIDIDIEGLQRLMGIPVVKINPRKNKGIKELKKVITDVYKAGAHAASKPFIDIEEYAGDWLQQIQGGLELPTGYSALHVACSYKELSFLTENQRIIVEEIIAKTDFHKAKVQAEEIMQRYRKIGGITEKCVVENSPLKQSMMSERLDKVLLHPWWGNLVLLLVLFTMFQSIFWLAEYPMNWVEAGFGYLTNIFNSLLPDSLVKDLLVNGLLAGIGGIVIFIPQIMILFGFITLLEDTGYMARISFLSDRLMRSVGLNGRSVMPLISGMACAVPAVMAARTIQNKKERLITIMVTPLMSCSARLPVYTILIGLVIPDKTLFIFNLQGLVMMGLYLVGFLMALIVAKVMTIIIKTKERSFFLMELPVYRAPRWNNVVTTMVEKAKIFVVDAGKVIIVISLLLWVLATFGPTEKMQAVTAKYELAKKQHPGQTEELEKLESMEKLENSYAGIMGKAIEPAITPLGYDWKIGIAIITSFAAREVFVGTMSTLYSVGSDASDDTVREKMRAARRPDGTPVYTLGSGVSLLMFYVFAMQCMSTLAIVRRETGTWKYPALQFVYMLGLAYITAYIAFHIFS